MVRNSRRVIRLHFVFLFVMAIDQSLSSALLIVSELRTECPCDAAGQWSAGRCGLDPTQRFM